ncbi:GHKL domain-containing protein [Clostridium sp.]|uniref:GHKL domain-containing protein n=1 Tax=Clostridium sp. TaxID=1506 RepID=UPI003F2E612D
MKKVILYTLVVLTILLSSFLIQDKLNKSDKDKLSVVEYVAELEKNYNNDKDKILNKLNEDISDNKNSKKYIGFNILSRQYCFYLWLDTKNLIKHADQTETYLKKYNMENELLDFYSMMSSRYIGDGNYNMGYIYVGRGEYIAKKMYNEDKSKETLSTLIAIKYLKAVIALDIGMEKEAETVFKEAEKLRKEDIRERVDVYINILLYYQDKKEYDLVEEYATKVIRLVKEKYSEHERYNRDRIKATIILAENYVHKEEIDKSIEITNELINDEEIFKMNIFNDEMHYLYSEIYKYYGKPQESIKYLKLAYTKMENTKLKSQKIKIIESIIEQLEEIGEEKELLYWHKIESDILKTSQNSLDTQYLLSEIINTDLSNAKYSIEMLQLQKYKMIYLIIMLLLLLTIIIITVVILQKRKKLLKENISILEENIIINKKYYENIKTNNENIKRIKHDIKNHIIVINKLMLEKEYEDALNYIKHIENEIDRNSVEVTTNNKIIDAIIFSKIELCKSENINLDLDIKIPEKIEVEDFDICVIYGNLLDNAIEACTKIDKSKANRYIKFKSIIKGDYLYINIKNSYTGNLNIKEDNFITIKKDKINHGIGIKNIKKSIKKYDGDIQINYDEKEFQVSIIINNNLIIQ